MKRCVLFTLLFVLSRSAMPAGASFPDIAGTQARSSAGALLVPGQMGFDRGAFYAAMAAGRRGAIDSQLAIVAQLPPKDGEAFEGALLMRKAGLPGRAREKLATFRSGAVKLERRIAGDSANAEYHFLRLLIQEHAPKVVHYDKDRESDSRIVIRAFREMPPALQSAVRNYCPHSRFIHESDLHG